MASDVRNFIINVLTRSDTSGLDRVNNQMSIAARRLQSLQLFAGGLVLTRVGDQMTRMGKGILAFANDSREMAMEFDRGMRLVNTQAHLTTREFANLQSRTLELGRTVPQSLGELNESLYDVFSSVDIMGDKVKSATGILKLFSQAATGGQAPLRETARGAIAMVNAFGMIPNVQSFTKVLDTQFRLVEKGVGTYEEFSKALGDILPSSKATGQSLDAMSAALAFATRRGLTAAKAGLSVARSFDLMARPEIAKKLKKVFGIDVVDKATGQFRDFNDVLVDMGRKLQNVTQPARVAALQAVFGKQRPAAVRFIKQAVENYDLLADMQEQVTDNQGAMNRAFKEMSASPAVKLQIAMNNFRVAMVKFGAVIVPLATKVINFFSGIFDWLNKLSPGMRRLIVIAGLATGAFLVLGGTLFKLMGSFLLFQSMIVLMQTATGGASLGILGLAKNMGFLLLKIGLVVAVVAALIILWKKNQTAAIALAGALAILAVRMIAVRMSAMGAALGLFAGGFGPLTIAIIAATGALMAWNKVVENNKKVQDENAKVVDERLIPGLLRGQGVLQSMNGITLTQTNAMREFGTSLSDVYGSLRGLATGTTSTYDALGKLAAVTGRSRQEMNEHINGQFRQAFASAAQKKNLYGVGQSFLELNRFMRISHQGMQLSVADFIRMGRASGLSAREMRRAMAEAGGLNKNLRAVGVQAAQMDRILAVAGNRRMLIKTLKDMGFQGQQLQQILRAITSDKYAIDISVRTNIQVQIANLKDSIRHLRNVISTLMAVSDAAADLGKGKGGTKPLAGQIVLLSKLEGQLAALESSAKRTSSSNTNLARSFGGTADGAAKAKKEIEAFTNTAKRQLADANTAFRRLGANLSAALIQGARMTGPQQIAALDQSIKVVTSVVGDRFNDLYSQIARAVQARKLNPGFLKAADRIRKDGAKLLNALQTLRDQMIAMQQSIIEGFNQTSLVKEFAAKPAVSAPELLSWYAQKIAQAKEWGAALQELARAGLNQNLLNQLASAGPESLGLAKAILAAGVGKINAFEAELQGIAARTAGGVTATLFGPQMAALSRQAAALGTQVDRFIRGLKADALRRQANGVLNALGAFAAGVRKVYASLVSGLRSAGFRLPGLQQGAIVTRPGVYAFAERHAEAAIPLDRRGARFLARSLQYAWPHTRERQEPSRTNHFHLAPSKDDIHTQIVELDWWMRNRGD